MSDIQFSGQTPSFRHDIFRIHDTNNNERVDAGDEFTRTSGAGTEHEKTVPLKLKSELQDELAAIYGITNLKGLQFENLGKYLETLNDLEGRIESDTLTKISDKDRMRLIKSGSLAGIKYNDISAGLAMLHSKFIYHRLNMLHSAIPNSKAVAEIDFATEGNNLIQAADFFLAHISPRRAQKFHTNGHMPYDQQIIESQITPSLAADYARLIDNIKTEFTDTMKLIGESETDLSALLLKIDALIARLEEAVSYETQLQHRDISTDELISRSLITLKKILAEYSSSADESFKAGKKALLSSAAPKTFPDSAYFESEVKRARSVFAHYAISQFISQESTTEEIVQAEVKYFGELAADRVNDAKQARAKINELMTQKISITASNPELKREGEKRIRQAKNQIIDELFASIKGSIELALNFQYESLRVQNDFPTDPLTDRLLDAEALLDIASDVSETNASSLTWSGLYDYAPYTLATFRIAKAQGRDVVKLEDRFDALFPGYRITNGK